MYPKKSPRLWQLDALRGVAILLMVAFHIVFDSSVFFGVKPLDYHHSFWYYEGKLAAILFIGLAGVVSALVGAQKNVLRGVRLILMGLIITFVTRVIYPEWTIWFGILHFLGVGILLSIFFARLGRFNAVLGLLAIGLGAIVTSWRASHWFGLVFGVRPYDFQTFDYYPLFPWFGVMLLGMAVGHWITQKRTLAATPPPCTAKPLLWLGKYSLWIYFANQPILLGILSLIF
ncbi:MAG: heparan-alpha-glucosaminide N-acetyltransferase [Candidatus Peregrinibacteria bacterium]